MIDSSLTPHFAIAACTGAPPQAGTGDEADVHIQARDQAAGRSAELDLKAFELGLTPEHLERPLDGATLLGIIVPKITLFYSRKDEVMVLASKKPSRFR